MMSAIYYGLVAALSTALLIVNYDSDKWAWYLMLVFTAIMYAFTIIDVICGIMVKRQKRKETERKYREKVVYDLLQDVRVRLSDCTDIDGDGYWDFVYESVQQLIREKKQAEKAAFAYEKELRETKHQLARAEANDFSIEQIKKLGEMQIIAHCIKTDEWFQGTAENLLEWLAKLVSQK